VKSPKRPLADDPAGPQADRTSLLAHAGRGHRRRPIRKWFIPGPRDSAEASSLPAAALIAASAERSNMLGVAGRLAPFARSWRRHASKAWRRAFELVDQPSSYLGRHRLALVVALMAEAPEDAQRQSIRAGSLPALARPPACRAGQGREAAPGVYLCSCNSMISGFQRGRRSSPGASRHHLFWPWLTKAISMRH